MNFYCCCIVLLFVALQNVSCESANSANLEFVLEELSYLRNKVDSQEKEIQKVNKDLKLKNEELRNHKNLIIELRNIILKQEEKLNYHETILSDLGGAPTTKMSTDDTDVDILKKHTGNHTENYRSTLVKRRRNTGNFTRSSTRPDVGFTVLMDGDVNVNQGRTLIFPHVMTITSDNSYDQFTGLFICKFAGLYAFYYAVECYPGNNYEVYIELVTNNGHRLSHTHCKGSDVHIIGSSFAVVALNQFDRVWLRVEEGSAKIGGKSTFSGFLI